MSRDQKNSVYHLVWICTSNSGFGGQTGPANRKVGNTVLY